MRESTQNIGINLRIEDIVALKEKKIQQLRERGVPENQLEKEFAKECSLGNEVIKEDLVSITE